jgi:hypothetical protein
LLELDGSTARVAHEAMGPAWWNEVSTIGSPL